jgi:polar amino acid transport system substrate-binding protein
MKRPMQAFVIGLSGIALVLTACGKSSPSSGGTSSPSPSGSFGVTKDATIAAEVPAAFASSGVVRIPTDASYAPDEYFDTDNKTIIGMDIDLMNAILGVLGLKAQYSNLTFKSIIPALQAGRGDVSISSFFDNKDREKVVDFVDYFQAGSAIFVKADNTASYTSLDQLCGKAVSVEKGTTEVDDANAGSAKCVKDGKPKITVLSFDDQNQTNLAVISGRAEASLADSQVAAYQVKVTNGQVKVTGNYLAPIVYGIAIQRPAGSAPGSGPLTKPIFDALQKLMSTGIYKQILDKWGNGTGAITAAKINGAA